MAKNKIVINGIVIETTKGNISVENGRVFIDNKEVTKGMDTGKHVEIHIHGNTGDITTDASVTVSGNVEGNIHARGSVTAHNVGKSVDAGGTVRAHDIHGDVDAGGSVTANIIHGDIDAGGSVRRGN